MSLPRRAAAIAAVLLISLITPGSLTPASANGGPGSVTLYGHASQGWGLSNTSVTTPGPNLTAFAGFPFTLLLIGLDSPDHDWFVDYNGNEQTDAGEPASDIFQGAGPTPFTFVPDRIGNWTYRCSFHPRTMFGTIRVIALTNVTLHGDAELGWGRTNSSIRSPGPGLAFVAGTNVTFELLSNDTPVVFHNFFIDYDGGLSPSPGEPRSENFDSGSSLMVTLPIDRAGNFTYYCQYHQGTMRGNVVVIGTAPPGPGFNVALIPGVMGLALAGVLIFAIVYHVRATRAAKRHR